MFGGQHPGGEALFVVARQHRHGRLADQGAFVDPVGHPMHAASMQLDAGVQGPLVGVEACEGG